jgi:hypothetical protein
MEPSQADPLVRALKRLTLAIWALVVVSAVYVGIYLSEYIPFVSSPAQLTSGQVTASGPPPAVVSNFEQLHGLPPEEMVKRATVITISKYEVDGARGKCVLTEILKQKPGVKFYYKIGDEFQRCSFDPKEDASYGDGQVTFFVGNPAEMRFAASFFGDRISGLADMPMADLRALIEADQKAAR